MSRDVSGNYTLPAGNPVVTNTTISSVWANTTLSDLATAMTNSLDRTGFSAGMTGQFKAASGAIGAPGISWQLETTSGWYRNAAGDFRFSIASTDVLKVTSGAAAVTLQVTSGAAAATAIADLQISRAGSTINVYQEGPNLTLNDTTNTKTGALQVSGGQLEVYQNGIQVAFWNVNRGHVLNAPASGHALDINVLNSTTGFTITDGTGTLAQLTDAGHEFYFGTSTNHGFHLRTNASNRIDISNAGNVTINAPSSGTALAVNGPAGGFIGAFSAVAGTDVLVALQRNGTNFGFAGNGSALAGSSADFAAFWGSAGNGLSLGSNANERLRITSAGNVTINAPSAAGGSLVVNGAANFNTVNVFASTTASQSFGLFITAGTNSSDAAFTIANAAASTTFFKVRGDGAIQGGGPVAAALVDMTPDKGTFTATLTGMSSGGTGTLNWVRMGNIVILYANAAITGTSNATTLTITGLPAAIQPTNLNSIVCQQYGPQFTNNSVVGVVGIATFNSASVIGCSICNGGTFQSPTFLLNGWTAAGTKGLVAGWSITYSLA